MSPKLYALGITALAIATASGLTGWKLRDADYQAHLKKDAQAEAKGQADTRKVEARNETISQDHREEVAQQQAQVQVVYRTVIEKVPVYVTRTKFEERVVAGGGLPAGLVWAYNQSATNSPLALPTGLDPDTPTGVDVSTLAGITAGNFAVCQTWRAELQQWHAWYNDLARDWPGSVSKEKDTTSND